MDAIREQLIYKEGRVRVCLKDLTIQEQYELIRLLLATRTKDVIICKHSSVNMYINILLDDLNLETADCSLSK